jgi:hypothetical protein
VNAVGDHTLIYTYTDTNGNTGNEVERTVTVQDTTPPTATISYSTTGVINQDVTATLTASEPLQSLTGWDGTGAIYTKGYSQNAEEEVTFYDLSANFGTAHVSITWIDKELPVITLSGDATVTLELFTPYIETATVSDNYDTGIQLIISGSVNTGLVGTYTLTYNATDQANNKAEQQTRTIDIIDTTPPTATITYSTTGATNQNVTATLTASEPLQALTGWSGTGAIYTKLYT